MPTVIAVAIIVVGVACGWIVGTMIGRRIVRHIESKRTPRLGGPDAR